MTRTELGRLLAENKTVVVLALKEAIHQHNALVSCGMRPCKLREAYEELLTELENPR